MGNIVIIATLDTKGEEANYVKEAVFERGHNAIVVDVSLGSRSRIRCDITNEEVANAAGAKIDELLSSKDRRKITEIMIKGAVSKLEEFAETTEIDGIVALGGVSGTVLASGIMKKLPFGLPKLIISSAISLPGSNKFFGHADITVMHSVVDIGGLNSLLKAQLKKAAGAICGMAESQVQLFNTNTLKPMIAITTYGYTEHCSHNIWQALKEKYEPVKFHASGAPEIAMEKLLEKGLFAGVIDLVPSSITNMMFGGSRTSWAKRLEIAGKLKLPQVVAPGGVNTFVYTGFEINSLEAEIKSRTHYFMDHQRVTMWLTADELKEVTSVYITKLNKALGPTKFLVPMKGWLSIEREGSPYYDPRAIKDFVSEIKQRLKIGIELREIDANIDDPIFAEAVIEAFHEVMK